MIRVLLVDDQPAVRRGVRLLLEEQPDMEVCGEAGTAEEALRAVQEQRPDVAVVDLFLARATNIGLIRELRAGYPQVQVLVFSGREEMFSVQRALRAGARGYVVRAERPEWLVEGIRRIFGGAVFLTDRLKSGALSSYLCGKLDGSGGGPDNLTVREAEVLELIGSGLTTAQIAEQLGLSAKTIGAYRDRLKRRLGLPTNAALVRRAVQWVQGLPDA